MHAHVINGVVVDYPYFLRRQDGGSPARCAKRLYPEVSPLPGSWGQCSPEQLVALHSVPVIVAAQPDLQTGETCSEGVPELVGGQWRQTWVVTPAPEPGPPPVPQLVESHKIKIALTALGWRAEVEELVATSSQSIKDAWTAPYMSRDSVLLNQCALALGKTEEQVDDLFRMADGLVT